MPRANQTILADTTRATEPDATIAVLQAQGAFVGGRAPETVPAPELPEFIRKQVGLLPADSGAVVIPHGPGRFDGRRYELGHHRGGFPVITSKATGRMFAITWEALIKLAIAGGIDEADVSREEASTEIVRPDTRAAKGTGENPKS